MTQRLTQAFVDSQVANGRDHIIFDSQLPGLGLRITLTGKRIFLVQARVARKKRRITLGYPPDMSLSQARSEALQTLAAMRGGVDPTAERKARLRASAAKTVTVKDLSDRWLTEFVVPKLKPRTVLDYRQLLSGRVLPALGNLTVVEIDRAHIERLHLDLKNTPRRANYAVTVVRALLSFAVRHGLRTNNPAAGIKLYRENKRERFLSEAEIGAAADGISRAEAAGTIGPFAAAGLRLALFTGARSGEITSIKWDYIDFERRLIRLPDSKNNEPRTIHLSDSAVEVLRNTPHAGPFVVAGMKRGVPYKNLTHAWARARKYAGLDDVRLHDLRHSYASLAAGRGVSLYTIGKLLGHKDPVSTQRYAHLARDAVQAVNDELGTAMQAAIDNNKKPRSKVLKLRERLP
jgi:integrase